MFFSFLKKTIKNQIFLIYYSNTDCPVIQPKAAKDADKKAPLQQKTRKITSGFCFR